MQTFTRYLSVRPGNAGRLRVSITDSSALALLHNALSDNAGLRYSPIFPAYIVPGQSPPSIPREVTSVAFFFSRSPYKALGLMKPELGRDELERVYFTQGLASILCVNCDLPRTRALREHMMPQLLEYWPLREGELDPSEVVADVGALQGAPADRMVVSTDATGEITVYVEQILASIVALRESYVIYNPEEVKTLDRVARLTEQLIKRYREVSTRDTKDVEQFLGNQKGCNAIVSALAELSASLSYAVTQGTSGCTPILANRSPFPHFSLLGVGGAVRALTKFTRYLESAFAVRDVSGVIEKRYSCRDSDVPCRIAVYNSGEEYKFPRSQDKVSEEFDLGGEFRQKENVPLIAYFSLRHGFKESKFAVTAASESLSTEVSPQWTMMTLSHEIMHNQVRLIFQTLFGASWDQDRDSVPSPQHYTEFREWYESRGSGNAFKLDCAIRGAILHFCLAMDRAMDVRSARRNDVERDIPGLAELGESYGRHKLLAVELFVHFHDYFFAYACQQRMYTMSLWASWIKVAAPYVRPLEYLIRTLATVACGTGLEPNAAFEHAAEILDDALAALQRSNVRSPLFDKLRSLVKDERAHAIFRPSYYLIDQVRRFFASSTIASQIDRIEDDPFAEGSTLASHYSATLGVYGEVDGKSFVSPIRYSLASFLRSILGQSHITDRQWLTAWNTIVISSQETNQC